MADPLLFAFDLDGVLVDTIGTLYSTYFNILKGRGATGTPEEFEFLNGKKIETIARHLTSTHQLDCHESELLAQFQEKFDTLYWDVELIPGARELLEFLHAHEARIALSSSSHRKNIDVILKKFELSQFFETIVSGDQVKQAKPDPEIYHRVKQHFQSNHCFVVEDSFNGIQAARRAGLIAIHFSPTPPPQPTHASYIVTKLSEIQTLISQRNDSPLLLTKGTSLEISQATDDQQVPLDVQNRIDMIWETESKINPALFDSPIIGYGTHDMTSDGTLKIKAIAGRYKTFIAQRNDDSIDLIRPLAVSGVLMDRRQNILVGKRSSEVTEYAEHYELVPSGGLTPEHCWGDDYRQQIAIELTEETGIPASAIHQITPLGLLYDSQHRVYDIGVFIELNMEVSLDQLHSSEYSAFLLMSPGQARAHVNGHDWVPVSRLLLDAIDDRKPADSSLI